MASGSRLPSKPTSDAEPPRSFANVPASTPMLDHSFMLQAVMEVQKAVGVLTAKTDRLVTDFEKRSDQLDDVRRTIAFVKGACWVIGSLIVAGWAVFLAYVARVLR